MKNKRKIFIIAEAGVNHNGSIAIAKKLIKSAAKIGADAVKFQTFITRAYGNLVKIIGQNNNEI